MDDQVRIGDAERDRAAAELGEHYAQGRITTEEHAERLYRIWASRTRADLAPVFADLPGPYGPVVPVLAGGRPRGPFRRGLPGPVVAVLAVLLVLTIATHLPLVLVGVLVVLFVTARRRLHHASHSWSRPGR